MIFCGEYAAFAYKQTLATLASCLVCFCSGTVLGITSVMLPQLREDKTIQYTASHETWIASIPSLSLIIGSLCYGQIADCYGRKISIIGIAIPYIVGWAVIACANSTSIILVGRFISGLSRGASRTVTMVYVGEIMDPKLRSVALLLPGSTLYLGTTICHIIGYYTSWKTCALLCIFPPVLFVIPFIYLKESPLWLIAKGRIEEGVESFQWFRGTNDVSEAELKAVLERQVEKPKMSAKETLKIMSTRTFIIPMLILMVVVLDLSLSGVIILTVYSMDIFEKAFSGILSPFTLTMIMDCFRVVGAYVICGLGSVVSKKIGILICSFGASLSVFGLVACLITKYDVTWVPVLCLVVYITLSSATFSIGYTFVPELLPGSVRGIGTGLNVGLSSIIQFCLAQTAPDVMNSYGEAAMFGFFGVSMFVCGTILCFILPDTNGMTLQSIEDSYTMKPIKESQ